jgi:hypothetical protein
MRPLIATIDFTRRSPGEWCGGEEAKLIYSTEYYLVDLTNY